MHPLYIRVGTFKFEDLTIGLPANSDEKSRLLRGDCVRHVACLSTGCYGRGNRGRNGLGKIGRGHSQNGFGKRRREMQDRVWRTWRLYRHWGYKKREEANTIVETDA